MLSGPRREAFIQEWRRKHGDRCIYCGRHMLFGPAGHNDPVFGATLDHVLPRLLGGHSGPTNLALACAACNREKGHSTRFLIGAFLRLWGRLDKQERIIESLEQIIGELGGEVPARRPAPGRVPEGRLPLCTKCGQPRSRLVRHRCTWLVDSERVVLELGERVADAMSREQARGPGDRERISAIGGRVQKAARRARVLVRS